MMTQKMIVGILKQGQEAAEKEEKKKKRPPPPRAKAPSFLDAAYPDYGRSIVSRMRKDPQQAGIQRGLEYGAIGSTLGALIAAIASKNNKMRNVALGAMGGAAAGGIPGYVSGKREAESDYSKLLFLRRLGVRTPGELSAMHTLPGASDKVLGAEGLI